MEATRKASGDEAPAMRLAEATAHATDLDGLADAVVGWLEDQGLPLPSVYVELAGRLRCLAVRGYWQILEGFTLERGVLAETFRTGTPQLVPDVRLQPDYIAAVPGVVAELCLPLRHGGHVVGGLNVESHRTLTDTDVAAAAQAAAAFEHRLAELGGPPPESPWQRLARRSAELAALTDPDAIGRYAVRAACEVTGFTSAVLAVQARGHLSVLGTCGPLGEQLRGLSEDALTAITAWTASATSAYTIGSIDGSGFPGHEALRAAGVGALASATLPSNGDRHGFLLAAGPEPIGLDRDRVQHLEIVAAHTASALHTSYAVEALEERAGQDALTGLGHGATFHEDLERRQRTARGLIAVLLVDLDGFKQVNDTHGHGAGDRVLVGTAAALAGALRAGDRLYRIGGDEFAAIVEIGRPVEADRIAARLNAAAREAGGATVSIGVTVVRGSTPRDTDAVLADADLALYETKRAGRDGATRYRPAFRTAAVDRARTIGELAGGIERGELVLHYQPVVDLGRDGVLGVEALVRWQHPARGLIPPADFIGLAEEAGLIDDVGRWVVDEACRQLAAWLGEGWARPDLRMAVNVSAGEVRPRLVDDVGAALRRHGVPADHLVLEVTESVFLEEGAASATLARLRELGVHVAIDDFGTGYSSLSYLHRLPVDILKIDRSFVTALGTPSNAAIVRAIVDLGRTLGLSTLAEGIEDPAQIGQLLALGCEHAQGYLWSRPVPAAELPAVCARLAGCGPAGSAGPTGVPGPAAVPALAVGG